MTEDANKKPCCQHKKPKLYVVSELPLYGDPYPPQDRLITEESGYLENGIRSVRESVGPYASAVSSYYGRAEKFVRTGIDHSVTTYKYITDEANTVPKAVAITGGGFLGLLLASRKGFFKKLWYTGVGLAGSAAICYPQQTQDLARVGFYIIKTKAPPLITEYTGVWETFEIFGKWSANQTQASDEVKQQNESNIIPVVSQTKTQAENESQVAQDFGQSNKRDEDLYANRSTK